MEGIELPRGARVPRIEEAGTPEFRVLIQEALKAPAAEELKAIWADEIERLYKEASGLVDTNNVTSIDPRVLSIQNMSNNSLVHDIGFAATEGIAKDEALYVLELLKVFMKRLELANKQVTQH